MTIVFRCEHCGKDVKAPDEAGGKRGKCPYCHQSNFIPSPVADEDIIPLAPIDEAEERKRQQEIRRLLEAQKPLLAETGGEAPVPLEQREDLGPQDLYHFVVNYCLDLLDSRLDRAPTHLRELKKFPGMARQAVDDFLSGRASEPVMERIPPRVRQGFLNQLKAELR